MQTQVSKYWKWGAIALVAFLLLLLIYRWYSKKKLPGVVVVNPPVYVKNGLPVITEIESPGGFSGRV
jgi:hypothetical protein